MPANPRSKSRPNDGEHIKDIVSRTPCLRHKAPKGIPCFHIHFDTKETYGPAICNDRVVKAGFIGKISVNSMSRKQRPEVKRSQPRSHVSSQ